MKRSGTMMLLAVTAAILPGQVHAGYPKDPVSKCAADAVPVGSVCMDKYEASVWRIPPANLSGGSNASLIKKVRKGKATAADLAAGNATHLGLATDDYAPCGDNGQNCANDIYAVSLPGVPPSEVLTWFQAQAACKNSGKRLPSNAEWQVAASGTPDPGLDNGTTDCNTTSTTYYLPEDPVNTGSRSGCVSARGAYDMVGNLAEWVAEWMPRSTACPNWGAFSNDAMCLSGADLFATAPGALLRGGLFGHGTTAGPLSVFSWEPSSTDVGIGFRCAR